MKLYLAGPWSYGDELRAVRKHLYEQAPSHITVTSSWLDIPMTQHAETLGEASDYACFDLADIDRADTLVLFNPPAHPQTPGRNIEFGYALAKGKALWIVGRRLGVFQQLPHIKGFRDAEDLCWYLTSSYDPAAAPYEG